MPGRLVASRWLPIYLAALIFALGLPSLAGGFLGDDYFQRVWLLGRARLPGVDPALLHDRPVLDAELHFNGDARANAKLMDLGILPWWSAPDLRVAFFRPLASLTQGLDYCLWPDSAAAMHAHSLVWAALCVLAAGSLYRRVLPPASPVLTGLAACLFAADSARGVPSYWLADRYSLVALFFGTLAIMAHVRGKDEGWKPGLFLAPALLAAALFSAEAAVATTAYLFAHALFLERGTVRERAQALIPYLLVVVVWYLAYVGLGYGVRASAAYADPVAEPMRFVGAFVQHAPVLLLGEWIDLDLAMWLLGAGRRLLLAGAVADIVMVLVLLPLLRRDARARFWALGMLLSLVPASVGMPSARYLFFAGLGAAGLLAQLFVRALGSPAAPPLRQRWAGVLVCVLLVGSRGVLGPLMLFAKAQLGKGEDPLLINTALDRTVEHQTLVVLNPPSALYIAVLPFVRVVRGQPVPFRMRGLAASGASGRATRSDDRTLEVRVKGGYLEELQDSVFRDTRRTMRPGQRIELAGMAVEVVSIKDDGRPWEVRFRFDVPLEHPSLRWMQWNGHAYAPFRPPSVGETVEFSPAGLGPPRSAR